MSTPTPRAPRARQGAAASTSNPFAGLGIGSLSSGSIALASLAGLTGYGGGGPIYDLIQALAGVSDLQAGVDDAFASFTEAQAMQNGQAGVSYSEKYDAFSLAVKSEGNVFYFSLLHDKDRNPIVEQNMVLCQCQLNRDFSIEEEGVKRVILTKGSVIYKALPIAYVNKLKKVA
jgi:hypothetical protein